MSAGGAHRQSPHAAGGRLIKGIDLTGHEKDGPRPVAPAVRGPGTATGESDGLEGFKAAFRVLIKKGIQFGQSRQPPVSMAPAMEIFTVELRLLPGDILTIIRCRPHEAGTGIKHGIAAYGRKSAVLRLSPGPAAQ